MRNIESLYTVVLWNDFFLIDWTTVSFEKEVMIQILFLIISYIGFMG